MGFSKGRVQLKRVEEVAWIQEVDRYAGQIRAFEGAGDGLNTMEDADEMALGGHCCSFGAAEHNSRVAPFCW